MHGPDETDLSDLERALAAMQPTAGTFSRDQVMFQAGQSALHRRRRWFWPGATAVMTGVAACLGLALLTRTAPTPVVEYVYVDRPVTAPPSLAESPLPPPAPETVAAEAMPVPPSESYWHLHEMFVRLGSAPLPQSTALGTTPDRLPAVMPTTSVRDWRRAAPLASSPLDSGVN